MPDGRRIFLGSRLVDVQDSTSTPVGTFDNVPEELTIQGTAVSPDGTRVLFSAFSQVEECDFTEEPVECWMVDQPPAIYVVNLDGSGLTELTGHADQSRASWSPDGTKIAFSRLSQIHTMNADGGNQTSLGVTGSNPLWSPDGLQLLFEQPHGLVATAFVLTGTSWGRTARIPRISSRATRSSRTVPASRAGSRSRTGRRSAPV
jgi:Tol biopolymer transport system component